MVEEHLIVCISADLVLFITRHYEELTKGAMLSDAIIAMSSLNLIAGEMDA